MEICYLVIAPANDAIPGANQVTVSTNVLPTLLLPLLITHAQSTTSVRRAAPMVLSM